MLLVAPTWCTCLFLFLHLSSLFFAFCRLILLQMFWLHSLPMLGFIHLPNKGICLLICWCICLLGLPLLVRVFLCLYYFLFVLLLIAIFALVTGALWPRKTVSTGHMPLSNVKIGLHLCWVMCNAGFFLLGWTCLCFFSIFPLFYLLPFFVVLTGTLWPHKTLPMDMFLQYKYDFGVQHVVTCIWLVSLAHLCVLRHR